MKFPKIIIKNIGPITDVYLELNKINIFMGEQSSGKSTIAKIISYCQWVEKRYLLDGEYNYDFQEQFIEFHRVDQNYFNKDSFFHYESEYVSISYKGASHKKTIEKKSRNLEYLKSKNIYIPAERNFVSVVPNLGKYKETTDNIMSFLYDWYDAKKIYSKKKALSILSLGVDFYHLEESDSDFLILQKNKREISLKNASSGLQSVIPLIILIEYLTETFFRKKKPTSVNEKEGLKNLVSKILREYDEKNDILTNLSSKEINILFGLVKNRADYHYSNFVIEEPEQNLFPKTQKELIYYLIRKVSSLKREHTLTLTTHSPYILYALNNCIMAKLVEDKLSVEEKNELDCFQSVIEPKNISIYQIRNGEIENIQQEDGLIGENFFDNQMKEVMDEYYLMLNHY